MQNVVHASIFGLQKGAFSFVYSMKLYYSPDNIVLPKRLTHSGTGKKGNKEVRRVLKGIVLYSEFEYLLFVDFVAS